jgi:hypothetical protein
MLQIVTKMYFRPEVPLHESTHRDVYYSNALLPGSEVALPIGRLLPSSSLRFWFNTVTVEAHEFLEAVLNDGSPSIHVATGGLELIDDLADVLSFGLNVTFSRSIDLLRQLVPQYGTSRRGDTAAGLLRQTFEPAVSIGQEELESFIDFFDSLLSLERPSFEAAIRAIRRIRRACERAGENSTTSFTDLVAALESLSHEASTPAPTWSQLDPRKQKLFDTALADADEATATKVRKAALTSEHAGATHSFVQFTLDHLDPSYYRQGARGANTPVREPDAERLLKWAYRIRSQNVHRLAELREKYWIQPNHPETVRALVETDPEILTLEGMRRIATHVVKNYVSRSPKGVVPFDWRAELPGTAQVLLSSQYWIHQPSGLDKNSADRYFAGLIEQVIELHAGRGLLTEMPETLAKIESTVSGMADGAPKAYMLGTYALWDGVVDAENQRKEAKALLAKQSKSLIGFPFVNFVVDLFSDRLKDWTPEQLASAADARRAERGTKFHLRVPASLDAALQVFAAEARANQDDFDSARVYAGRAVLELPGNEVLLDWEKEISVGNVPELALNLIILGRPESEQPATSAPTETDAEATGRETNATDPGGADA